MGLKSVLPLLSQQLVLLLPGTRIIRFDLAVLAVSSRKHSSENFLSLCFLTDNLKNVKLPRPRFGNAIEWLFYNPFGGV